MHQVPREDQLELANAIAAGAQRRPQAFGAYFSDDGGSCALGAAYEGAYALPREVPAVAAASRSIVRLPRERAPAMSRRLQQAAAAQRDHSASQRRSSLDARA